MRNINKNQITLERCQLDLLLEQITDLSYLLLALKNTDLAQFDQCEIEGVISSIYRLNERNYAHLSRALGGRR